MLYIPDRRCYSNSSNDMEPLARGYQANNLRIPDASVLNIVATLSDVPYRSPGT
jgi:hypothetical protein